ncbi:MAG: hypothetical protein ABMB14_11600 [Myxococcota bacterium]
MARRTSVWLALAGCGDPGGIPEVPAVGVAPHRTWVAGEAYEWAGYALDAADTDGDGRAEILVGAPSTYVDSIPAQGGRGAAYLLPLTEEAGTLPGKATAVFTDRNYGTGVGSAVALPGDLTGDGVADYAVGGSLLDEPPVGVGVYAGPKAYASVLMSAITTRVTYDPHGPSAPGEVVRCGDVNGDGAADLCAGGGIGYEDTSFSDSYVFFGPLPAGDLSYAEADVVLRAPWGVWSPPNTEGDADVTGDGIPDLWIGANYLNGGIGGAFLVADPEPGIVTLVDRPTWTGEVVGDLIGGGLAIGDDLDGDGLGDLFLGSQAADERRGRGFVLTDKDGGPVADAWARFDGGDRDFLGVDAAIGDLDGDGAADLAIGAPRDVYFGFDRPGHVLVFRGPLASGVRTAADADLVLIGGSEPDAFGWTVVAAEADGDGLADLVVGAMFDPTAGVDAGAVHLFLGADLR